MGQVEVTFKRRTRANPDDPEPYPENKALDRMSNICYTYFDLYQQKYNAAPADVKERID